MQWYYEDELVEELPEIYGFIYKLSYENGQQYIGKKKLISSNSKEALLDGTKRDGHIKFFNRDILRDPDTGNIAHSKAKRAQLRIRKIKAIRIQYEEYGSESSWESYEGSHDKPESKLVKKEIIDLALSKTMLSYKEEYWLFLEKAILKDTYLNISIAGRYYRGKV